MTASPILFYGVPQGCSFGSIVALEWLGAPYRLCRIEMLEQPWDPLFAKVNPLFQTPALLPAQGPAIAESLAIQSHIAAAGIERGLGFRQGSADFDRLNQMLAYLNTDFFSAFNPLWIAYERDNLQPAQQELLRELGRENVVRQCAHLDQLLAGRDWLLGDARTVADAYLSGIGRWVGYHRLFDLEQDYPRLHRYLQRLDADPAVRFARAIEAQEEATSAGGFEGHVTLESLRERLQAA